MFKFVFVLGQGSYGIQMVVQTGKGQSLEESFRSLVLEN
jgi:hypothetical protein